MPVKTVDQIKKAVLHPSQSSHYNVYIGVPSDDFVGYLKSNGVIWGQSQEDIQLACAEASLPGSSFATHDITSDYPGVTEKHPYRKNYDGSIDLTFYVCVNPNSPYSVVRFFESWMRFIANESSVSSENSSRSRNFYYYTKYPDDYYGTLRINKFERSYESALNYEFLGVYPTSISSMPLGYDNNSILKCTVTFSYIRYNINQVPGGSDGRPSIQSAGQPGTPLLNPFSDIERVPQAVLDAWTRNSKILPSEYGQFAQLEWKNPYKAEDAPGQAAYRKEVSELLNNANLLGNPETRAKLSSLNDYSYEFATKIAGSNQPTAYDIERNLNRGMTFGAAYRAARGIRL